MKISKLEILKTGWYWGGRKLKNPLHILLTIAMLPLYYTGKFLTATSVMISDMSLSSFKWAWDSV